MGVMRTSLGDPRVCERLGVLSGEYVTLAVADTGCGMDERTAAHIFEPFFTTKEAGKGTGLGLATVYGVVRQSGGGIDVETSPGRGTTFRVYLPVAHDQLAQAEDMSERDTRAGVGTVLLVEDETPLRAILRRSLEAAGYAVLEADSGDAALSVVQSHRGDIDVLLTDVVMPGMNGVVLSQAVTHRRPRIRVLFMSGHAADSFARHDFDPNAVRFLQKPFSADVLHREVHDALAA
jgi:CheY-like chemotaxis protein